jgi:Zn-dependent peptidase ImmA (M78 family)
LSDAERKNMKARNEDWENELWSLIGSGDGTNCPLYETCQLRQKSKDCVSGYTAYTNTMHKFLDKDSIILPLSYQKLPRILACVASSRIFELVRKLAHSYTKKIGLKELPVETDVIQHFRFNQPVEVRLVPLKSAHGAVWHLRHDGWVIHLNSRDSSARRRFTFYHELFHILAHCNASPVFKKSPSQKEGAFNELLADHFAAIMIVPEEMLLKKWAEVKDIRKLAAIFDVPEPIIYCGLKHLRLI